MPKFEKKEKEEKKDKSSSIIVFSICVVAYSLPVAYLIAGIADREVEADYIDGLLTASGILLGFLFAVASQKRQELGSFHYNLITACIGSFAAVAIFVSTAVIRNRLTVWEVSFI